MCEVYRKLNAATTKIKFPLPLIDEQLNNLVGFKYFIALDLASGYYQVPIKEEHRNYTSFITPDGLFEFNVMPFSLVNAPSLFQKLMNGIVQKIRPETIVCYMDDVVLPAKSIQDGMKKLEKFLVILKEANLTLSLKKCTFFQTEIEFLGHVVKNGTIKPGKLKILVVQNFEKPTNEHEGRQFIGLTSYFRKFIKNFAIIALPLTNLTKKNCVFVWGRKEQSTFENLKQRLTNKPVLALYNQLAEHELHTDASSHGSAGVILQRDGRLLQPVAYFSRKTSK